MSNRIEMELKYFCNNEEELTKMLKKEKMQKLDEINEVDEYFTDINSEFIKNRTCMRIRKTNDEKIELTFKEKSKQFSNYYEKKEKNIPLLINQYMDIKEFLFSIGYLTYVKVDKDRVVYTKQVDDLIFNIMIDKVKNVGDFIEFEVLSLQEYLDKDERRKVEEKLLAFVDNFKELDLKVAELPYRDFVAQKLYEKMKPQEDLKCIIFDVDGIIIKEDSDIDDTEKIQLDKELEENVEINISLLKQLKQKGIKLVVFTVHKKDVIDNLLEKMDEKDLLDCVIAGEDLEKIKPNKEEYNKTMEDINLLKKNCIAVEDSNKFIETALIILNNA